MFNIIFIMIFTVAIFTSCLSQKQEKILNGVCSNGNYQSCIDWAISVHLKNNDYMLLSFVVADIFDKFDRSKYANLCTKNDGRACFYSGIVDWYTGYKLKALSELEKSCDLINEEIPCAYYFRFTYEQGAKDIAIRKLKERCSIKKGLYCKFMGDAYNEYSENEKAQTYYKVSCDSGIDAGCEMYFHNLGEQERSKHVNIMQNSCSGGSGKNCYILSKYFKNIGNEQKSLEYLDKSCESDLLVACMELLDIRQKNEAEKLEMKRAYIYKQCEKKNVFACGNVAKWEKEKNNKTLSDKLYEFSCINKYCLDEYDSYSSKLKLYEKFCKKDNARLCTVYAAYLLHEGLQQDNKKKVEEAKQLFDRSCKAGNSTGCYGLGIIYNYMRDSEKVFLYLEMAFKYGEMEFNKIKQDKNLENLSNEVRFSELIDKYSQKPKAL